jgi:single-strand DNA-binding protein
MTNGEAVTNVSAATSESWKDKSGEKQEKTEWHNLTFYRRLAEVAGQYLKKGALIYVEGKLQTRKWTDKEGNDKYTTEIIVNEMTMLGGKSQGEHAEPAARQDAAPAEKTKPAAAKGGAFDNFDDDLPF